MVGCHKVNICNASPLCKHTLIMLSGPRATKKRCRYDTDNAQIRMDTNLLVPLAGVEPARPQRRLILSQVRLPIPPQRHVNTEQNYIIIVGSVCQWICEKSGCFHTRIFASGSSVLRPVPQSSITATQKDWKSWRI